METARTLAIIAALPLLLLTLLALFAWRYRRFIRKALEESGGSPLPDSAAVAAAARAPVHALGVRWLDATTTETGPGHEQAEAAAVTRRMRGAFIVAGVSHMVLTTAAILGAFEHAPIHGRIGIAYLAPLPGLVLLSWLVTSSWRTRVTVAVAYLLVGLALVPAIGGFARAARVIAVEADLPALWPLFGLTFLLVRRLRPIAVGLAAVVVYFVAGMPLMALLLSIRSVDVSHAAPWLFVLGAINPVLAIVVLAWLLRRPTVRGPVAALVVLGVAGVAFGWITPGLPIGPILLGLPGNVLQFYLVWLAFEGFIALKQRHVLPDQVLHSHLCWLYLTAYFATVASHGPGQPSGFSRYTAIAILAFPVQVVVLQALLRRIRTERLAVEPRRLLLLRVFAGGRRLHWLLDVLDDGWRRIGRMDLIVGPDVALRTVSARMLAAFLRGRTDRLFLNTADEVDRRLSSLESRLGGDARFPVNELHCRGDTWQLAVKRLAPASDVILMDLRRFTRNRLGCIYELTEVIRLVALERIVILTDRDTDAPALEEVANEAWAQLPPGSPNRAHASPSLSVLRCSGGSTDARAIESLLYAASRRTPDERPTARSRSGRPSDVPSSSRLSPTV